MKQPRVTYDSVGIEVSNFSDETLPVGSGTLYRPAAFFLTIFQDRDLRVIYWCPSMAVMCKWISESHSWSWEF